MKAQMARTCAKTIDLRDEDDGTRNKSMEKDWCNGWGISVMHSRKHDMGDRSNSLKEMPSAC